MWDDDVVVNCAALEAAGHVGVDNTVSVTAWMQLVHSRAPGGCEKRRGISEPRWSSNQ